MLKIFWAFVRYLVYWFWYIGDRSCAYCGKAITNADQPWYSLPSGRDCHRNCYGQFVQVYLNEYGEAAIKGLIELEPAISAALTTPQAIESGLKTNYKHYITLLDEYFKSGQLTRKTNNGK